MNTGTVAIQAALKAVGIQPGDEVLVPAYTWEGTVGPVLLVNAVPVFVDVDPETYCIDAKLIEQAITPKTRVILPVHLGMRFADLDAIMAIAQKHNLKVVEDCAHVHGGMWRGKGAGSIGDLGAFSFQSSKLITCGEGGAVITNNLEYFERVQSYINTGRGERDGQIQAPDDRVQLPAGRIPGVGSGAAARPSAEAAADPPGEHRILRSAGADDARAWVSEGRAAHHADGAVFDTC